MDYIAYLVIIPNFRSSSPEVFYKGPYVKYVEGGARVLKFFQRKFCSPEDHRAKYFMAQ